MERWRKDEKHFKGNERSLQSVDETHRREDVICFVGNIVKMQLSQNENGFQEINDIKSRRVGKNQRQTEVGYRRKWDGRK
ncbi:hypothetical protein Csa_016993 [Cucumis sativus]|nr:hypothetical protein Csa_016993 [Cucumis sativus]